MNKKGQERDQQGRVIERAGKLFATCLGSLVLYIQLRIYRAPWAMCPLLDHTKARKESQEVLERMTALDRARDGGAIPSRGNLSGRGMR